MAIADFGFSELTHPVDLVESIASHHDWPFERSGEDELTMVVAGTFADYHISMNWREDLETLHLACAFEFKSPENRLTEVYRLVAYINEQLWIGHFDIWHADGLLMFRHALILTGTSPNRSQCETLLFAGVEACERYFQAFQFVTWAGKSARESLATAMFETEGQA